MNPTPSLSVADRPRPPPPDVLQKGFGRLLRPLVRLAMRAGITFPMLAELLRGLYVEVATEDLLAEGRARTDSRVSLMTGVHRKELRRQRLVECAEEPAAVTLAARVIGRWVGSPALTDAGGRPVAIPRLGAENSFEALVSAVTRDIRPRALLDTLLDQGVLVLEADDRVRLQELAFIPQADREIQTFYFARNLHDHAAAAAANVSTAGAAPFLERAVHYDGLSAAACAEIAAVAREAAMTALLETNRQALAIADADDAAAVPGTPRGHRAILGLYLFSEEERRP